MSANRLQHFALTVIIIVTLQSCLGFTRTARFSQQRSSELFQHKKEDEFVVSQNGDKDYDLQPPYFNLRKESLLFDENAATHKNNNVRRLWESCQTNLPQIIHGARRDNTTIDPLGAIYNMIFVRIPIIVAGLFYLKNELTGYPLIVDFGDGAFEMPPLVVAGIVYVLLR